MQIISILLLFPFKISVELEQCRHLILLPKFNVYYQQTLVVVIAKTLTFIIILTAEKCSII